MFSNRFFSSTILGLAMLTPLACGPGVGRSNSDPSSEASSLASNGAANSQPAASPAQSPAAAPSALAQSSSPASAAPVVAPASAPVAPSSPGPANPAPASPAPSLGMGQAPSPSPSAPAPATDSLQATDVYASTGTPSWKTSFVISDTYNVFFAVDVPASMTGTHQVIVFIYSPDGSLFQRNTLSFATDATATAGQQQAIQTAAGYRVWTSIPVAGTAIDNFGMTGSWSAQAYLDSSATANASLTFDLQ